MLRPALALLRVLTRREDVEALLALHQARAEIKPLEPVPVTGHVAAALAELDRAAEADIRRRVAEDGDAETALEELERALARSGAAAAAALIEARRERNGHHGRSAIRKAFRSAV